MRVCGDDAARPMKYPAGHTVLVRSRRQTAHCRKRRSRLNLNRSAGTLLTRRLLCPFPPRRLWLKGAKDAKRSAEKQRHRFRK